MKNIIAVCATAFLYGLGYPAIAQNIIQHEQGIIPMEDAITRVLNAAPSIRASEASVQASRGTQKQMHTKLNPELSLDVENIMGSGDFNGLSQAEVTLGVKQKIERGGKRDARIGLADADHLLARLSVSVTQADVIYAVRQAYIDVMVALALQENALKRLMTARALEKTVSAQVKQARGSAVARARVGAATLEIMADLEQAGYELSRAKHNLSALWGEPNADFKIEPRLFTQISLVDDAEVQSRLNDLPDMLFAKAGESRAIAALRLERAKSKQDMSVKVGLRQYQYTDDVAATVSFSMPLAFFNKNEGNIERATAERKRSEWMARDLRQRLNRELNAYQVTFRAAYAEVNAFRDGVILKAQAALDEARKGFARGGFSYLEVLEAERSLQNYQHREIMALKKFHQANAAIDRLTTEYGSPLSGVEK